MNLREMSPKQLIVEWEIYTAATMFLQDEHLLRGAIAKIAEIEQELARRGLSYTAKQHGAIYVESEDLAPMNSVWTEADFETIKFKSRTIAGHEHGFCMLRTEANTIYGCWCAGAGPGGGNLPCPPKREEDPPTEELPPFHFPDMPIPWKGRTP